MLSGRGLCDELITRPEEFYRLRCVIAYDLETSRMRRPWPALDLRATGGDCCLYLSVCIIISVMHGHTNIKSTTPFGSVDG